MVVRDLLNQLERLAPARRAMSWDAIGLQVGNPTASVHRVLCALDRSWGAVRHAAEHRYDTLITHHPLFLRPPRNFALEDPDRILAASLLEFRIAHIAAHTNWDCATHGVNDALAARLGLTGVIEFGSATEVPWITVTVFVPADHADAVIDAMSAAGAGTMGRYERCAFVSPGTGTFVPLPGANPAIGQVGRAESVAEVRIEMSAPAECSARITAAIRQAHPYELPAIHTVPMLPVREQRFGRVGELPSPMSLAEFATWVADRLGTRPWTWGDPDRAVRRVAVVGGAASGEWREALGMADVFITGEVKQHDALDAVSANLAIMAAGHYETEQPGVVALAERLREALPT
ncbi:MAG: Nif3-like dinuclear metal center hexameric protein, partial [Fimbriimonadaceae bacterium]|nr:Nif3-like dinuclear metal center hexameric protein [Fimbriimonadaceae bacterium]